MKISPSKTLLNSRKRRQGSFFSLFQLFHPSIIWCFLSNLITTVVYRYFKWYYWPNRIYTKFGSPCKYYIQARIFHISRYIIYISILIFSYVYYKSNNDTYFLYLLIPLFVILIVDIILKQGADVIAFMHFRSESILSLILLSDDFRIPFLNKYDQIQQQYQIITPVILKKDKKFVSYLTTTVEELQDSLDNTLRIKLFSLIPLSLRHILSILYVYALLILCLEINWQNQGQGYAYENLGHTAPMNRGISTFIKDYTSCLYFQSVTITTTGFGDISPNKKSPTIRFIQFILLLEVVFTIFVSINISLKAGDQVLERLKNKDLLEKDIISFMCKSDPYLIIH